jgi:hypothetical protein
VPVIIVIIETMWSTSEASIKIFTGVFQLGS